MCSVFYEHMFVITTHATTAKAPDETTPRAAAPRVRVHTKRRARRVGGRVALKMFALAALALVAWSVLARPSGAHGPETVYRVRAYDTLWSIAQAHYRGDVRDGVWQIQHANHLAGSTIVPGEKLVLP
jgi:nucleoid-associated protein YgaU